MAAPAPAADLRSLILHALAAPPASIPDSFAFAAGNGVDHVALVGAMKSLEAKSMVLPTQLQREVLQLTEEAAGYAASGTPEFQLYAAVPEAGISGEEPRPGHAGCVASMVHAFAPRAVRVRRPTVPYSACSNILCTPGGHV